MILCITGMHRSGTSLIASWLQNCGMILDDGQVWGPADGNIKGHFEDKEFATLNANALQVHYPHSKGWIALPQFPLPFFGDNLDRARKLISTRNLKYTQWGWKDPRTTFFLNTWKELIPELKVLILWRSCVDVVNSLLRRSHKSSLNVMKIRAWQTARLWCAYNNILCSYKEAFSQDTLLLPLGNVLQQDQDVFQLICHMFSLNLNYIPITQLYDSRLIQRGEPTLKSRLLCRLSNSQIITVRLHELSDTIH